MKPVRLLVIGDPHGSEKLLKLDTRGYDAIIITGDVGKSDIMRKLAWRKTKPDKRAVRNSYLEYVSSAIPILEHISKSVPTFCVSGNVELSDDDIRELNKKLGSGIPLFQAKLKKMKNLVFLDYAAARFKGLTMAGIGHFLETRWVNEFSEKRIDKIILAAIEENVARLFFENVGRVDIMISHQPPYGILDKVGSRYAPPKGWKGKNAGSWLLLDYIRKYHPRYVICGHIHEAKGMKKVGRTRVINAGCCGDWQGLIVKK